MLIKNCTNQLCIPLAENKSKIKFGLILTAFTLLILAFANPQVGTKMQEVKQTGIDVYILLDVSRSMQAEDIKPNRLEKAKYQISNLIQKLRGDRIGLIIFSGEAYIQFPLNYRLFCCKFIFYPQ